MCPKCKNIGWKKSKFEKKPVIPYGVERIKTHDGEITIRYKRCLQCNYKFRTMEKFDGDVKENKNAG